MLHTLKKKLIKKVLKVCIGQRKAKDTDQIFWNHKYSLKMCIINFLSFSISEFEKPNHDDQSMGRTGKTIYMYIYTALQLRITKTPFMS